MVWGSHHSLKKREHAREGGGTKSREDLGRAESAVHSFSIFIGPCASVESSSNTYCFCNASKFLALIDGAFTGSQSLPQSQTPLRDGEKEELEKERKRKIQGMVWLTLWSTEKSSICWSSQLTCSEELACVIVCDTPGSEKNFLRGSLLKSTSGCIKLKNRDWELFSNMNKHATGPTSMDPNEKKKKKKMSADVF